MKYTVQIFIFLFLTSCSEQVEQKQTKVFIPFKEGNSWVYHVRYILWSNNQTFESVYFERDSIALVDSSPNSVIAYFYRHRRIDAEGLWNEVSSFSIEKTYDGRFILNDGASQTVVLIDDISSSGNEWLANALNYNPNEQDIYFRGNYFSGQVSNNILCEGCVKVEQKYNMDCITENRNDFDIFMEGEGMLYQQRLYQKVDQNRTTLGCLDLYVDSGFEEYRELLSSSLN